MKSIDTLIPDIYQLIRDKEDGWFTDELAKHLSDNLTNRLRGSLGAKRYRPSIRMSSLGPKCPRALWYSLHRPETAEKFTPWAEIKFAYGHVLEGFILTLAKAAGHEVTGEQDALEFDGVIGHRDAVIDGVTTDVKSATSLSFQKFKTTNFGMVDSFGYLDQLDGYILAAANDPLVRDKRMGTLLAVDKTLGHLTLYKHRCSDQRRENLRERIKYYRSIEARESPPECECITEKQANGNIKLGWKAGYGEYKWECFPKLRACKYSGGITYFAKVVKWPKSSKDGRYLPELDRDGNTIYH